MALSFTVPVGTSDMLSSSFVGGGQGGQKIHGNAVENLHVLHGPLCLFLPCLAHQCLSISICEHSFVIAELAGFALY